MPIGTTIPNSYREDWASAVTQTTAQSPVRYGPFYMGPYSRVRIAIERTAEVGAQTMDAKVQWQDPTGDFADFLDHAGNALSFVQWTDGQTGLRHIECGIGVTSGDADDTITFGTNYKLYNVSMPAEFYVLVTGATGTSDTFSAFNEYYP